MSIALPTTPRQAVKTNPGTLLIYSMPKIGKSTVCAGLTTDFSPGNSLIISTEEGGYDYVDATVIEAFNPNLFNSILSEVENKNHYKYLVIDTITRLDEWSEVLGTYNYMRKPQGKKFNAGLTHKDPQWESVHTLPNGSGYQYSREVMVDWLMKLRSLAPHVILVAHIKDKYITTKTGDTVQSIDINLTGKVKDIYCSRVDAISYMTVEDNKRYLSFLSKSNAVGSRADHLEDKILISEKTGKKVETFWKNIFI